MTDALLVLGGLCSAWVLKSILLPLAAAELFGSFDDYLKRRVLNAQALLPDELASDLAQEWLEELDALGPRKVRAWLFVRGLPRAAAAIAAPCDAAGLLREKASAAHASSLPTPAEHGTVSGIDDLLNYCFYDGKLQRGRLGSSGETPTERAHASSVTHVRLVDIAGTERFQRLSVFNDAEVAGVVAELRELNDIAQRVDQDAPRGVAVITAYAAQQHRLREAIASRQFPALRIRVGVVDRFQGYDDEVVIFSATRSHTSGFLIQPDRISFVISRARSLLIVCAHVQHARAGRLGAPLKDVVAFVDERLAAGDDRFVLARLAP